MNRIFDELQLIITSISDIGNKNKVFHLIWKRHHKDLLAFIKFRFDFENAEDMAQEIMIKIYNNLHNYDFNFSFKTWFYTIARNYCIDCSRKKKHQNEEQKLENIELIDNYSNEKIINNELSCAISKLLNNESVELKEIYFLYYHECLTIREISKIVYIPEGTIKYNLFKFRNKIKNSLEDYCE